MFESRVIAEGHKAPSRNSTVPCPLRNERAYNERVYKSVSDAGLEKRHVSSSFRPLTVESNKSYPWTYCAGGDAFGNRTLVTRSTTVGSTSSTVPSQDLYRYSSAPSYTPPTPPPTYTYVPSYSTYAPSISTTPTFSSSSYTYTPTPTPTPTHTVTHTPTPTPSSPVFSAGYSQGAVQMVPKKCSPMMSLIIRAQLLLQEIEDYDSECVTITSEVTDTNLKSCLKLQELASPAASLSRSTSARTIHSNISASVNEKNKELQPSQSVEECDMSEGNPIHSDGAEETHRKSVDSRKYLRFKSVVVIRTFTTEPFEDEEIEQDSDKDILPPPTDH